MRINWAESWQLTSEIIEMLEIDLPIQEQERIASLLHSKDGEVWADHSQEWRPYVWPIVDGVDWNTQAAVEEAVGLED